MITRSGEGRVVKALVYQAFGSLKFAIAHSHPLCHLRTVGKVKPSHYSCDNPHCKIRTYQSTATSHTELESGAFAFHRIS